MAVSVNARLGFGCLAGFVPLGLISSFCLFLLHFGFSPLKKLWLEERSFLEDQSSTLVHSKLGLELLERYDDIGLELDTYACLPLCSFAHAFEGRSLQTGTPEIAIATYARPCGIWRRNGMPWGRLIPRVGMLTTTGPLGTAQAGLPTSRSYENWNKLNQM
uniref:Uncharacterized protein n=1 Tax=Ananas comosus var. bracteatus TaxID=296719 RepID=A0A6V7NXV1_ANACO|nr:unnamed protein product [Ananas comosus var. bracteatus]